jgi:hypothetical protein
MTPRGPVSLIGKEVIIRSYGAGVFHGTLSHRDASSATVQLRDATRLYYWPVKRMTGQVSSCSELAQHGILKSSAKLGAKLPIHEIGGVIEIIPLSAEAAGTFA